MADIDALDQGRELYRQRAWQDAFELLARADDASPLGPSDLERLATAAYLTGREADFRRLLERAYHERQGAGDLAGAARCAFWIALALLFQGEVGQANGWLGRGRTLLEDRDCVEQGFLLLPRAELYLADGDEISAYTYAASAVDIGCRFSSSDLVASARHLQGRALVQRGEVARGLALLDEAMLSVISGELSPIMTGLVYCSVIEACQHVFALGRAREWTAALARWCDDQPEMVAFTATCLVRRAEIMQSRGAWDEALVEVNRACARGAPDTQSSPSGAALYRRGEIHRLRGEFASAEEAYRGAALSGWEPQPGLALLRVAQGRNDMARAAIGRVLGAASDPLVRARLLPAHVDIALAAGDKEEARTAVEELEGIAERYAADVLRALAAHARGTLALADGKAHGAREALEPLRRAFDLWQRVGVPYEGARERVFIGSACHALGDDEGALLEFDAAEAVFERLGAAPDLAHLRSVSARPAATRPRILTARESQVLRLIAAGQTNRAIATALRLSERTVDRHVSNILTRLGVPSRAAATAYAYEHGLLSRG